MAFPKNVKRVLLEANPLSPAELSARVQELEIKVAFLERELSSLRKSLAKQHYNNSRNYNPRRSLPDFDQIIPQPSKTNENINR